MKAKALQSVDGQFAIREANETDLPQIQAIYAYHVLHGLGSFEEIPPDIEELGRRRAEVVRQGLPYFVGEVDGQVIGYAYAGLFRSRSAYRFTVEDSIYVAPDAQRRGVARQLLTRLIATCEARGYRQMLAVIGDSGNHGSIGLHAALGFRAVAKLESVGFKLGRWVDSLIMQRALGPGDSGPPIG